MPASIAATSSRLSGLAQSTPETSPANAGCSWRNDTDISVISLWPRFPMDRARPHDGTQPAGLAVLGAFREALVCLPRHAPYRVVGTSNIPCPEVHHVHRDEPLQGRTRIGSGLRKGLDDARQPSVGRARASPPSICCAARNTTITCSTRRTPSGAAKTTSRPGHDRRHFAGRTRTPAEQQPLSRPSRIRRLRRHPDDRGRQRLTGGFRCASTARSCLVTGAGSGIGRATAIGFAQRGGKVVVADVNGDSAEAVAAEISGAGGTATAIVADMANPADIDAMVARTVEQFGRLDVLHNNAFGVPATLRREPAGPRRRDRPGGVGLHDPGRPHRGHAGDHAPPCRSCSARAAAPSSTPRRSPACSPITASPPTT